LPEVKKKCEKISTYAALQLEYQNDIFYPSTKKKEIPNFSHVYEILMLYARG